MNEELHQQDRPGVDTEELVEAAFAAAQEQARWRAAAHGTKLIYAGSDGEVVEVDPGPPYVKKRAGG